MDSLQFKILLLFVCVIISQGLTVRQQKHTRLKDNDLLAFRNAELEKHNDLRSLHNAAPLKIDFLANRDAQ